MAPSVAVGMRPYTGFEHDVVRAFKTSPEVMHVKNSPEPLLLLDSSSEDEDHEKLKSLILKGTTELEPSIFDPRDEGTFDQWIQRNMTLVRLTGKHPFNTEPPLPRLMHHGFITPVPLHFVRNHGPIPRARWEDGTVEVLGLTKHPTRFTMYQLVREFPS